MVWLIIGYMWLFTHRPFEVWPALAPLHLERVYMIAMLAYWATTSPSFRGTNRLHRYFALFVGVMLVSWWLSPFQAKGDETVGNYLKYAVFYIILVTSIHDVAQLRQILLGYLGAMGLFMAHCLREYFSGRAMYEQGIVRLLPVGASFDYNDLAGLVVCSLPLVWMFWHESTAWQARAMVLAYLALSVLCVLLTGSRMGFIGFILAGMIACMASPKRWLFVAIAPVVFAAVWIALPDSRRSRYLSLIDPSQVSKTAMGSAGNWRLAGFQYSLPLFDEQPLLGWGPESFATASRLGHRPHNLYGQLLAEMGTLGTLSFGLILLGVAQNFFEGRRYVRAGLAGGDLLSWRAIAAASASIVLLAIMSWGFNFLYWHVWLWFGGFQVVALRCLRNQVVLAQWRLGGALQMPSARVSS